MPQHLAGLLARCEKFGLGDLKRVSLHRPDLLRPALFDAYEGWPLIFFAVRGVKTECITWLLKQLPDPNITCPPGLPILAFVVLHNARPYSKEMVRTLLAQGADPTCLPVEVVESFDPGAWARVRDRATKAPGTLPPWWMAAPEAWLARLLRVFHPSLRLALQNRYRQIQGLPPTPSLFPVCPPVQEPAPAPPKLARQTVILISGERGLTLGAINCLVHAMGYKQSMVWLGSLLRHQPELQAHASMREDLRDEYWQLEAYLTKTAGKEGLIVVSDIDHSPRENAKAIEKMAQLWYDSRYVSRRNGWSVSTDNVLWVLTTSHTRGSNGMDAVWEDLQSSQELAALVPRLDHVLRWDATCKPVDFSSHIHSLVDVHGTGEGVGRSKA